MPAVGDKAHQEIVEALLSGDNFHFGNPISSFFKDLQGSSRCNYFLKISAGVLTPEVQKAKQEYKQLKYKFYVQSLRDYNTTMLGKTMSSILTHFQ